MPRFLSVAEPCRALELPWNGRLGCAAVWLCMTRRHVLQLSKPRLEFIASLGYKSYLIEVRRRRASLLTRATYSTYHDIAGKT